MFVLNSVNSDDGNNHNGPHAMPSEMITVDIELSIKPVQLHQMGSSNAK